jgi:broad-specificity NMP kinase
MKLYKITYDPGGKCRNTDRFNQVSTLRGGELMGVYPAAAKKLKNLPRPDEAHYDDYYDCEDDEVEVAKPSFLTAPMPTKERAFTQFSTNGHKYYRPSMETVPRINPGLYSFERDDNGIYIDSRDVNTSELIRFPDTIASTLINEFSFFWTLRKKYEERGEQHKRGFLLHGPPGGGKTSVITFIIQDFIKEDGVVFEFNGTLLGGIRNFREVEPDRKVLVLMEDIDSYIDTNMEGPVLNFLDGSFKHVNTIVIATTNYLDMLPSRLKNRPSRFDRVEEILNPSRAEREIFIEKKAISSSKKIKAQMLEDSEDYTFAHIKELILSLEVYGLEYEDTLKRLAKMREAIKKDTGFVHD